MRISGSTWDGWVTFSVHPNSTAFTTLPIQRMPTKILAFYLAFSTIFLERPLPHVLFILKPVYMTHGFLRKIKSAFSCCQKTGGFKPFIPSKRSSRGNGLVMKRAVILFQAQSQKIYKGQSPLLPLTQTCCYAFFLAKPQRRTETPGFWKQIHPAPCAFAHLCVLREINQ